MAMRTIKTFDSPGGRFSLEEAQAAVRALHEDTAKKTAAKKRHLPPPPVPKKSRADKSTE